jgi:hypothetical protein
MSNDHEWLNLIEVSGPFLAVPVLRDVFPQGLEALPSGRPQRLRRTYDEWRDAVDMDDPDLPALHAAWIDDVLQTALEMDGTVLLKSATLPERLTVSLPEHGVTVAPDLAVVNPTNSDEPLLLIHVYAPDTDLDATHRFDGLAITPADRMVALLRATGCPTGIVTNGERWMLVHAPVGAVAGFASWYARLWGQEPETLRAFVSLLGVRRFFGPDEGKLPALYERSLKHQDDVTEALGEQVRRAVEVLVQALDRADQDRNRELLRDVDPRELYEAGLTIMMRLVFLLAAEERALLLLGDPRYDSFYAISSLRMQLRADSEEILERRRSAWSRLLAVFRGVYGGIDHPTLRLPALGGSLFDPDRYPFLEGRKKGTSWRSDPAEPLPIDDRTVLLLLEAIQTFEGRTLSYRALDVEQIGHVYEGLLERTVQRVDDVTLELGSGAKAKSPRVTLGEMESARLDGTARVAELLKERSERSESAIRNDLERLTDDGLAARLLTVCRGDIGLRDRILPYAPLLRTDPWGYPLAHHKGAFVVVLGADRRESGTHYTPKSLTEKIVEETLTPVTYRGPAEGKAPEDWELKSVEELLDLKICDPAMGSGAFLVQACRWLSDRLVEAWSLTEASGKRIDSEGRILDKSDGAGFDPLSQDAEERAVVARRCIAERCLYGVDKNPLAVELAKLSLWLTTMSKGRPFGFLDHNLRSGDSLLGIHDIRQLIELSMAPKGAKQLRLFGRSIRAAVDEAVALRMRLRAIPIQDIGDVDAMAALDGESRKALQLPKLLADAFVGVVLAEARAAERADRIQALEGLADAATTGTVLAIKRLKSDALADLRIDAPDGLSRDLFHWPLEFPEVFASERCGFDAFIGNPPFLGGQKITGAMGTAYREYLVEHIAGGMRGSADFVAYFFLRTFSLLSDRGLFGLIAVNTIAEGDTRDVGLGQLLKSDGVIVTAYPNEVWPGTANVVTSRVHIAKSSWAGKRSLSGREVSYISSYLGLSETWAPKKLAKNLGYAFQGSIVLGDGFLLDENEKNDLLNRRPEAKEVIYPYLIGREVNQSPTHTPGRWVINLFDWEKDECLSKFPEAMEILRERVKPEREKQKNESAKRNWWRHYRFGFDLYHKIGLGEKYHSHPDGWKPPQRLERVIVFATGATKYPCFTMVPNKYVYANSLCVVASDSFGLLGCLSSDIHAVWAWEQGSRMKQDLRYTHGDIFETFPLPQGVLDDLNADLATLGEELFSTRREVMLTAAKGLTAFYNDFHDQTLKRQDIGRSRDIQVNLNKAILSAYGMDNVDLELGFHDVGYLPAGKNTRFTMSEKARREILSRLSELNKARYTEQEETDEAPDTAISKSACGCQGKGGTDTQVEFALEAPQRDGSSGTGVRNGAAEGIETYLRTRRSWLSKSDILADVDVPDGHWNAAINDLIARGRIERQGERRGARYRITERG